MEPFPTFTEYLDRRMTGGLRPGEFPEIGESKLVPGLGKAVNPSRPVSPLNSKPLASPFRKRFMSQVVGR
jgi:hypothetical protein